MNARGAEMPTAALAVVGAGPAALAVLLRISRGACDVCASASSRAHARHLQVLPPGRELRKGFGHNVSPVREESVACETCNGASVLPQRFRKWSA